MNSWRLPGKVLMEVQGTPLLSYLMTQLRQVQKAQSITIATSTHPMDEAIALFCKKEGIHCFRGSEENVLERYFFSAKDSKADGVVRITADCPLIDPNIVDDCIQVYLNGSFDYVSNCLNRSYPRGMDTEVFSIKTLTTAYERAKSQEEKNHVTQYIYTHPKEFSIGELRHKEDLSFHRWTVDEKSDFTLIEKIINSLLENDMECSMPNILALFKKHPEWIDINKDIKQVS